MKSLIKNIFYLNLSVLVIVVFITGCQKQQTKDTKSVSEVLDIQKAKTIIEAIDKQFSKDYYNGDSAALANNCVYRRL